MDGTPKYRHILEGLLYTCIFGNAPHVAPQPSISMSGRAGAVVILQNLAILCWFMGGNRILVKSTSD